MVIPSLLTHQDNNHVFYSKAFAVQDDHSSLPNSPSTSHKLPQFKLHFSTMLHSAKQVFSALLLAAAAVSAATIYKGDGTGYTLSAPIDGNCNMMYADSNAATNYVAINAPQWSYQQCGRCVKVSCIDAGCKNNATVTYQILDKCPECKSGDLDTSNALYKTLTGSTPNRLKVQWQFVDCPITGKLQYCLKDGSNQYWVAIQPANSFATVKSMTINGVATSPVDGAYYYFIQSSTPVDLTKVKVVLTSTAGEVITDTVNLTVGKCTAGKFQFTKSTAN